MQLQRSDKARLELASRVRALNVRERGVLFLADGSRTLGELQQLLQDDGGLVERLVADGYLISPLPVPTRTADATPVTPPGAGAIPTLPGADQAGSSADAFAGKRSLAATRMFLFDICERMFARKAPSLALHFRDALREARDRDAMLAIAREIVASVEGMAGAERAVGLSERIARLLPAEPVEA